MAGGVRHTVMGADFGNTAVSFIPPIPTGLEYMNFFGGAAPLGRNLAPGKAAASVNGSPTVAPHSARMTGAAHYIQTAAPASDAFTLLAVARAVLPDTTGAALISNTNSLWQGGAGTTFGAGILFSDVTPNDSQLRLSVQQAVVSASAPSNRSTPTASFDASTAGVLAVVGRSMANGDRKAKILTTGVEATALTSSLPFALGEPYRIGSQYNAANILPVDIYMAAIWSRALTDQEVADFYTYVKAFYAARSVTI